MKVQLQSGAFEEEVTSDTGDRLDKKALLVYCGEFQSLDGPVQIKDEDIEKLAANHNGLFAKFSRMATGAEIPAKFMPPIQLDHSTSAKDTVGRLVGNLMPGDFETGDGKKVKALYGTVRILGKENVDKVRDGRWTHLSIGADLENHTLSELTITPFPAAPEASLLSKKRLEEAFEEGDRAEVVSDLQDLPKGTKVRIVQKVGSFYIVKDKQGQQSSVHGSDLRHLSRLAKQQYRGFTIETLETGDDNRWTAKVDGDDLGLMVGSAAEAYKEAKAWVDEFHKNHKEMGKKMKNGFLKRLANWKKDDGDGYGYAEDCEVADIKGSVGKTSWGKDGVWTLVVGNYPSEGTNYFWAVFDADTEEAKSGTASNKASAKAAAESAARNLGLKLSTSIWKSIKKLSEGEETMDYKSMKEKMGMYEKCKKHMMDEKKMSEEDAEKELGAMDDEALSKMAADEDEREKKMAADEEEKKKLAAEEEEKKEKEMSAGRSKIVALAKSFKTAEDTAAQEGRKVRFMAKLSTLKAEGKVTPAEIKKLSLEEVGKKTDAEVDSMLETYSKREPQVLTGIFGTAKALTSVQLHKALTGSRKDLIRLETLKNMPSMKKQFEAEMKRLQEEGEKEVNVHIDNVPQGNHPTEMAEYDKMWDECSKMMTEGKVAEAKEHMRKYYSGLMTKGMASEMPVGPDQMSAVAKELKKLQTEFSELVKLVGPQFGLKEADLA